MVHRLDGNVLAYEHDGLFLEFEGDLGLLRNEIKSVLGEFAFTLKPQLSVQSALKAAEAVICKNAGPHTLELECQGHPLAGAPHLRHEGIHIPADASWTRAVHVSMPYRVHEIFKILSDTGPAKKIWVMTGDPATDVLKWIVQVVCQRDLSDYKTAWRTAESAVEIESQWKFSNQSFVKAVADACRTHLCVRSSDWGLDDESTRHLLNFKGMVLNSKTLEWTPVRPTMRITRLRSWRSLRRRWRKSELVLEVRGRVRPEFRHPLKARRALQPHPGTGGTAAWTQDDWASTIYELMLLAKGTFGLKQAVTLWTRGVGGTARTLCAT